MTVTTFPPYYHPAPCVFVVKESNSDQWSLHIAAAVFDAFFLFFMLINVVYSVGIVFRTVRGMCCYECWHGPPGPRDHTYA